MNLSQKLWGFCAVLWGFEAGWAMAIHSWLWLAFSVVMAAFYGLLVVVSDD